MFVVMTVVLVRTREEEVTTVDISRMIPEACSVVEPVGEISTESVGCLMEHVLCVRVAWLSRRRRRKRGRATVVRQVDSSTFISLIYL
tara:strand:- start:24 stop:287 length:264 start_codon:yes stop_codon:yes gene_type:complete